MTRFPDFNVDVAARLTGDQQEVYGHVSMLLNRDHPVYTVNRRWKSLKEVETNCTFNLHRWVWSDGTQFESATDVMHGYYYVVRRIQWDSVGKFNREDFGVYQITNKGRALHMGGIFFATGQEAVDMIEILHKIEEGTF